MTEIFYLAVAFFFIALIYSSVGFGGGSSYLALLAQPFFHLLPEVIRPTALLCNIIVVTSGTYIFYRKGKIDVKEIWPFLILSVPLSLLGGYIRLNDQSFFILLGSTLVAASFFLWIQPINNDSTNRRGQVMRIDSLGFKLFLGGGIGFLSGLVSIGGGIFLAPILHLLKWSEPKKIAAFASVYILINSISGLAGQMQRGLPSFSGTYVLPLVVAVFAGGQIGSRLGAQKFNQLYVKRTTAVLIFIAGINILRDHLL